MINQLCDNIQAHSAALAQHNSRMANRRVCDDMILALYDVAELEQETSNIYWGKACRADDIGDVKAYSQASAKHSTIAMNALLAITAWQTARSML